MDNKNIENDFYLNDSLNNDLESRFQRYSWRCFEPELTIASVYYFVLFLMKNMLR